MDDRRATPTEENDITRAETPPPAYEGLAATESSNTPPPILPADTSRTTEAEEQLPQYRPSAPILMERAQETRRQLPRLAWRNDSNLQQILLGVTFALVSIILIAIAARTSAFSFSGSVPVIASFCGAAFVASVGFTIFRIRERPQILARQREAEQSLRDIASRQIPEAQALDLAEAAYAPPPLEGGPEFTPPNQTDFWPPDDTDAESQGTSPQGDRRLTPPFAAEQGARSPAGWREAENPDEADLESFGDDGASEEENDLVVARFRTTNTRGASATSSEPTLPNQIADTARGESPRRSPIIYDRRAENLAPRDQAQAEREQ